MKRSLLRGTTVHLLSGLLICASAQAQVADTISHKTPLFTSTDAVIFGSFALATVAVAPIDRYFATRLQDPAAQENRFLRTSATGFRLLGVPGSIGTSAGLYLLGRIQGSTRTADLGLHSGEAILLGSVVGGTIKVLAGRARPYEGIDNPRDFQLMRGLREDRYRSFPSGHTIAAFAFASTVSRETVMWWPNTRWTIGPVMYTGATLVGISRMYNNQHWASDVMAGAAIGTLIGLNVVRYQHSHPDNRLDRVLLSVTWIPGAGKIPGSFVLR